MPKLRGASTDLGAMTQYLARKCKIHKPHAELDLTVEGKKAAPRFGTSDIHKGAEVHMLVTSESREPNQFVAISKNGRAMLVTLEEVDPTSLDPDTFGKVAS